MDEHEVEVELMGCLAACGFFATVLGGGAGLVWAVWRLLHRG